MGDVWNFIKTIDFSTWLSILGYIGTYIAIYLTIRHYNKDRLIRFVIKANIPEMPLNKITITGFNASQSKTMVSYVGIFVEPFWQHFVLNILNVLVAKDFKLFRILGCHKYFSYWQRSLLKKNVFQFDTQNTYEDMEIDSFSKCDKVVCDKNIFITGIAEIMVNNHKLRNKILKKKMMKITIRFMRYDGKLYNLYLLYKKPKDEDKSWGFYNVIMNRVNELIKKKEEK